MQTEHEPGPTCAVSDSPPDGRPGAAAERGRSARWPAAWKWVAAALGMTAIALGLAAPATGQDAADAAAAATPVVNPPSNVTAIDRPLDGGNAIIVRWSAAAGDGTDVLSYRVERTLNPDEIAAADARRIRDAMDAARTAVIASVVEGDAAPGIASLSDEARAALRTARADAAEAARAATQAAIDAERTPERWTFVGVVLADERAADGEPYELVIDSLARLLEPVEADADANASSDAESAAAESAVAAAPLPATYRVRVAAVDADANRSVAVATAEPVGPREQYFDGSRGWLLFFLILFGGAVVVFIQLARSGREMKVRKIAGLEAVDEAVGRATEMGRSVLFVPGIQDMNEIQTIAGITVLARVAKTAAEYDARVEVPTARSLVMTSARETVQAAYLTAGRPDAYDEDLIYYVTNEQFGYVAYLSGMMVREKPAACIYMGAFYAESLILAETGNSIGAIQVAGTAQPAQLPFFVAACDYTLIGEEFYAASAYLSGSPAELGSLKGQDAGKVIVGILIVSGVLLMTLGAVTGGPESVFTGLAEGLREILK
ncbi:MAG: DUF6754 domain-containing protein [Phycisphaerales bacterium]